MNNDLLKEYVQLAEAKRKHEADLGAIKDRMAQLEQPLLEQFADAGMQNANINGSTVYVHRQLWASALDQERLVRILRRKGYKALCETKVNSSKLSALVREFDAEGKSLPKSLAGVIKVTEETKLRVRRA